MSLDPGPGEPARHVLRRRTVEYFRTHPDVPQGAIPAAVRHVVGGPVMWSDKPVRESQFTPEQRRLVMQASREIRELYQEAGGSMDPQMFNDEVLGLIPDNTRMFDYQSEEWAAARAINAGLAVEIPRYTTPDEHGRLELARAYYEVITWIDYVHGGLLDASEIYEDEEDPED